MGILRPQIPVAFFSSDKVGHQNSGSKGLIFPAANIPENPSHRAPQLWAPAWYGSLTPIEPPDLRLIHGSGPSPSIPVCDHEVWVPAIFLLPGKWATGWDRVKRKETGGWRSGAPNNKSNNNSQILRRPSARHAIKCFLNITSHSTTAPRGRNLHLFSRKLRDWSHLPEAMQLELWWEFQPSWTDPETVTHSLWCGWDQTNKQKGFFQLQRGRLKCQARQTQYLPCDIMTSSDVALRGFDGGWCFLNEFPMSRPGFLNSGTTDSWGQKILCWVGALWWPRGVGLVVVGGVVRGRLEKVWGGYTYTYSWFTWLYSRNQHNAGKQSSSK